MPAELTPARCRGRCAGRNTSPPIWSSFRRAKPRTRLLEQENELSRRAAPTRHKAPVGEPRTRSWRDLARGGMPVMVTCILLRLGRRPYYRSFAPHRRTGAEPGVPSEGAVRRPLLGSRVQPVSAGRRGLNPLGRRCLRGPRGGSRQPTVGSLSPASRCAARAVSRSAAAGRLVPVIGHQRQGASRVHRPSTDMWVPLVKGA